MQFATDAYFHIGLTHLNGGKPCQDYALSDVHHEMALCVVTDGCSTGGYTDVGARILAFATASAIREHWVTNHTVREDTTPLEINVRQKITMSGSRSTLGLSQQDMLATCAYQYITPNGGFVHLKGDGVVAYKTLGGHIVMYRYDWADNRPFYPAYVKDNLERFIADHGGNINTARLTCTCCEHSQDGFTQPTQKAFTLGEGIRGITIPFPPEDIQNLDCVAVFSDGVTQIEGLDWKDAVMQLLAFKTIEGEFAKRRMIRVIKDAQKTGRGCLDDIAYAVVRVIPS